MHRILPGFGIGGRYLADFSDTVAPALGLAHALATSAWTFLPPARISTTDLGPRGICLERSTILPLPILIPTAGLPPLMIVQRRILSPLESRQRWPRVNSSVCIGRSSATRWSGFRSDGTAPGSIRSETHALGIVISQGTFRLADSSRTECVLERALSRSCG